MPRLIKRNRALRKLDTSVVQEWLDHARARDHADAVLALELELSARGVCDEAIHEPRFSVHLLDDRSRATELQLSRLRRAVQRQSLSEFRDAMFALTPENFWAAWELTREFRAVWDRAEALRQAAFWIACYFRGYDDGVALVLRMTEEKSPAEIVRVLEAEFATVVAQEGEVQDA